MKKGLPALPTHEINDQAEEPKVQLKKHEVSGPARRRSGTMVEMSNCAHRDLRPLQLSFPHLDLAMQSLTYCMSRNLISICVFIIALLIRIRLPISGCCIAFS